MPRPGRRHWARTSEWFSPGRAPRAVLPARTAMLRRELAQVVRKTARTAGGAAKGPPPSVGAPGLTIQRRARSYAHAMYAWGLRNGLVETNPVSAVHLEGKATSRECVLTDTELGEAWKAAGLLAWPWGPLFPAADLDLAARFGDRRHQVV
jgi:hypothetical protein